MYVIADVLTLPHILVFSVAILSFLMELCLSRPRRDAPTALNFKCSAVEAKLCSSSFTLYFLLSCYSPLVLAKLDLLVNNVGADGSARLNVNLTPYAPISLLSTRSRTQTRAADMNLPSEDDSDERRREAEERSASDPRRTELAHSGGFFQNLP